MNLKYVLATGIFIGSFSMMQANATISFFKGMLRNPMQVGTIAPCSHFVAQEVTKYVAQENNYTQTGKVLNVLEVGGGTGQFTQELVDVLLKFAANGGKFRLDVVEIDPYYCSELKKQFGHYDNVHIHCSDIASWPTNAQYDYIVSSVPFNNCNIQVLDSILVQYESMLKPEGRISFIEIMGIQAIKKIFLLGNAKEEYVAKQALLSEFKGKFDTEKARVWLNVTPTRVYHLKRS